MLKGKSAVVTGAGSGMGAAIAKIFAANGAKVIAADINFDSVKGITDGITAEGGVAIPALCDVSRVDQVESMVQMAVDNFGSLDIMVNNAGIVDNFEPVSEVEDKVWEKVLAINLNGVFYGCRASVKAMLTQGKGGSIINTASVGGLFGTRGGASYVASKHAVVGLTKNIASTYSKENIRCNAIAPGGINTNIQSCITSPSQRGYVALQQCGPSDMGDPEDVAQLALFLASDQSKFINGDTIKIDGGWTAR